VRHETDGYVGDSEPNVKSDTFVGGNIAENLHLLFPAPEAISAARASVESRMIINSEYRAVSMGSTLKIKTRAFGSLELSEVASTLDLSDA
jgi:hypothetical protein